MMVVSLLVWDEEAQISRGYECHNVTHLSMHKIGRLQITQSHELTDFEMENGPFINLPTIFENVLQFTTSEEI